MPATNVEFWNNKFRRNERRDQTASQSLKQLGWQVHVVWECQTSRLDTLKEQLSKAIAMAGKPSGGIAACSSAALSKALDRCLPRDIEEKELTRGTACAEQKLRSVQARSASSEKTLNCVDLFAGAGGFSLAARQAGLTIKLAVEHNKNAAATYRRNLCISKNPTRLIEDDIRTLSAEKLRRETFVEGETCNILLGGPPCQGFSTHRLNDAGVSDDRNDLIHIYFDFVRAFAPKVFLMENVPGMLWARHEEALSRFYAEGKEAGYTLSDPIMIDARDYGLPQRRKRVFILGFSQSVSGKGLQWPPPPTHGSEVARRTDQRLHPWVSCSSVFDATDKDDVNDVHMNHSQTLIDAFAKTPHNGGSRHASGRMLACHKDHDGHNDVYGRIDPAKPAPTMTTACINPSKGRFVHPTLNHGITVRQAARIQTFPDWFVFEGGLMAAGEQVGNAVPVALGKHLIQHLLPLLAEQVPEAGTSDRPPVFA